MQLISEIRYSLRLLRNTPVFTGITLIVIVLGLTLYLSSYPMAKQMSDAPMPFPNGDRYVSLKTIDNQSGLDSGIANLDKFTYNYLLENSTSYSVLGANSGPSFVISDGEYAQQFTGAEITLELMAATAVSPLLGRSFTVDDAIAGAPATVLLSYSLWQNYYLSDPEIIGRASRINGQPLTVIGVMPEGYRFPYMTDLWVPMLLPESIQPGESSRVSVAGILKSGVSYETAGAELNANLQRLYDEYPETYTDQQAAIFPYASVMTAAVLDFPRFLQLISFLILCLAATNLSSLLFIRSSSRQQELLVRSSVGASGLHLARQVLLETFILCFVGFLLSLLFSTVVLQYIHSQILASSAGLPFWFDLKLERGALLNGLLVTVTIWLASGLLIAIKAYRSQPASLLNGSKIAGSGVGSSRVTSSVVGIEMALSFMLLIATGMTVYLMIQSTQAEFGVDVEDFLVGQVNLYQSPYEGEAQFSRYAQELQQVITENPRFESVALTNAPFGVSGSTGRYDLEDRSLEIDQQLPLQSSIWVSDNYFEIMGVETLSGRAFDATDTSDSEPVVILNTELASQLWPSSSPLGKRIKVQTTRHTEWLTVVGVIPKLVQSGLFEVELPNLYLPFKQMTPGYFFVVGKVNGGVSVSGLEQEFIQAARTVDRDIPLTRIHTLDVEIAKHQGGLDVIARIFTGIAFSTLLLAAIGIFGIVARSINLRTYEIGVRRALGSTEVAIISKFIRQGMRYMLTGLLLGGVPACVFILGAWNAFYDGPSVNSALTIIALIVTVTMTLLITLASFIPARQAVAMDPGDALRYE